MMADKDKNTELLEEPLLIDLSFAAQPSIIKVIGVGGGGDNAVANMYREGMAGVKMLACNTDRKALDASPIPDTLQLGPGLGAGGKPEKGRELALADIEKINQVLSDHTHMVFITAGMGGGTGTGASPVIARAAKQKGILTVGIVTIPFLFEGNRNIDKALDGVENLAKEVDALLVINNERLKDIYADFSLMEAFKMADKTLTKAVRSIVEIITMHGIMNLDFRDVETTLRDGGIAIISYGYGKGEHRVSKAIEDALNSPLLNHTDIFRAKRLIMSFTTSADDKKAITTEEYQEQVSTFMENFCEDVETKWGLQTDESLDDEVKVTILASGFKLYGEKEDVAPEDEEADYDKQERRENYYEQPRNKRRARHRHIFLYDADNLDNEELSTMVDDVPTAVRERQRLREMEQQALGAQAIPMDVDDFSLEAGQTIDFSQP